MSDLIRAFIAFELEEKVILKLSEIQNKLKSYKLDVKWVNPSGIHLTLKFLGNIFQSDISKIKAIMEDSIKGYLPISLKISNLGCFPSIKKTRVVWTGISGELTSLFNLQKKMEVNLESIGFPKEDRPFKGHLTLGRAKSPIDLTKIIDIAEEFFESESFICDKIILFKSDLKSHGAVYTKLITSIIK
ncbi:MAG: RNA 2',3'-cyclic phosphodiesterase [Desulfobacterales bacterium]|nr:RNA 2',3'-cyclic phosphodiesterase [Desulfobacterales bacterium]MBF0397130.1 RNA 2',3'-cyclic phosphodiesterase [Desulfobacterales bacterium]